MRIQTKFIVIITLTAVGVGLCSSWLVNSVMRSNIEIQLEEKAVCLAQAIAEHLTHNVICGQAIVVRETLVEIVGRTNDLDYAFVTGFDGELFAHTFNAGLPRALVHEPHELCSSGEHGLGAARVEKYSTSEGPIMDVRYPLVIGMRAHLHIGMNESRLAAQVSSLRNEILALTFVAVLLGITIAIVVNRRITRPLNLLSESMSEFGRMSKREKIVERGGGREVTDLTRAFNQMIAERMLAEEKHQQLEDQLPPQGTRRDHQGRKESH
jgi:methyl-accepting chemotaxis protein